MAYIEASSMSICERAEVISVHFSHLMSTPNLISHINDSQNVQEKFGNCVYMCSLLVGSKHTNMLFIT